MGDGQKHGLRVHFDGKVGSEFYDETITSDTGLLAYRELDDALGLTAIAENKLLDGPFGKNTWHSLGAHFTRCIIVQLAEVAVSR